MYRITKKDFENERQALEDILKAIGYEKNIIEPLNVQIFPGKASYDRAWQISFYKGHMLRLEGNSAREALQQIKAMSYILRVTR